MQWFIDPQPFYSFPTGFEIQHCTWGAMCVPSLLSLLSIFPSIFFSPSSVPLIQTFSISDSNSPWRYTPQVGIMDSAASGAHLCCLSCYSWTQGEFSPCKRENKRKKWYQSFLDAVAWRQLDWVKLELFGNGLMNFSALGRKTTVCVSGK